MPEEWNPGWRFFFLLKMNFLQFKSNPAPLTHPAHRLQSSRVDLVDVVDLGRGIVVLPVADDVDQVVVGEVGDDVREVRERPAQRLGQ